MLVNGNLGEDGSESDKSENKIAEEAKQQQSQPVQEGRPARFEAGLSSCGRRVMHFVL